MADISTMQQLAEKWLKGTITDEEKQVFESWYNEHPDQLEWLGDGSDEVVKQRMLETIQSRIATQADVIEMPSRTYSNRKTIGWRKIAVAASVLLVLGTGSWFFFFNRKPVQAIAKTTPSLIDIAPGTDKAILTLADGRQIILDQEKNGNVAEQGKVTVIKVDGKLTYNSAGPALRQAPGDNEVLYNTITVPRKGQYQLVLADGTKVWLDAESSLRYPTSFPGTERTVQLTGQGYFEVAKNAAKPFHVKTGTQDVAVLGTHFNVNSYGDEELVKTTLLEGSVKITAGNTSTGLRTQLLAPGQEAQLNKTGVISLVKNPDIEQTMAWKNGLFNFKSSSLRSIMNQVVRWYDVEVVYEGNQFIRLSGYVDRNIPLSQTLKLLETNGVRLRQEGKKIIMME